MMLFSLTCKIRHDGIDLVLGSHINAPGGFVENKNFRIREKPPGKKHFLLIPPGEVADQLPGGGGLHRKPLDPLLGISAHGPLVEQSSTPHVGGQVGGQKVELYRKHREDPRGSTLLREKGHFVLLRLDGRGEIRLTAVKAHLPRRPGNGDRREPP